MKYTITRQFSLNKEKFEIVSGSKTICTARASPSKEHKDLFKVKLTKPLTKSFADESCLIEPDPSTPRSYLIYIQNNESNEKILFGQLSYKMCTYDNYLYTIVIGKKLYKVRSCDLKNRRLAIIDTLEPQSPSTVDQPPVLQCPETLFQVIDSFAKSNKTYHVTIHDKEAQFGYLAIVLLIDLHECRRQP